MPTMIPIMDKQNAIFQKNIKKVIKKMNLIIDEALENLDVMKGKFLIDENLSKVLLIKQELKTALREAGYYDLSKMALKQNKDMIALNTSQIRNILKTRNIGKIDTKTLNGLLNLNFEGMLNLGDDALLGIQNNIYDAVLLGLPRPKLREQIAGKLGKFEAHAETYIRTTKRQFVQKMEDNIAENIGFGEDVDNDFYDYVGAPIQPNSHRECIYILEERPDTLFTQAEKDEFDAGTVDGISFNPARYNCQHYMSISNRKRK